MPNNKFSQISLFDIYEDVNTSFTEKKSELVSLLEKHIDFSSLISYEFRRAFYSNLGRKHKYHLESFIKALIIQKLFAFNLDSQLIIVLKNATSSPSETSNSRLIPFLIKTALKSLFICK